jgi:4-oxalocrotonate tautomerase family enzyme
MELKMPVANLHVLQGHPRAGLQRWIREASNAMCDILQAPADRLEVWVTEIDPQLWGIAGEPASEVFQNQARRSLEIPYIKMVLMPRTREQYQRLIVELTAITGRVLDVDATRVRIQIDETHPERWGIGGQPASVLRAAEIAARAQATPAG